MSKVLVTESNLQDIADAIRSKNEGTDTYRPGDMAAAILAIPTGSAGTLVSKTITQNGEYDPEDDNADGYSDVTVNVPNSYAAGDEGKVVSSGALVAQTSTTVTENGTYDTTENDEVVVNVSGGGGGSSNILSGTEEPTSAQGSDGDIFLHYIGGTFPSGYTAHLFIQSSGTQFIDTGVPARVQLKVEIDCCWLSSGDQTVIGGSSNINTNAIYLGYNSSNGKTYVGYAGSWHDFNSGAVDRNRHKWEIDLQTGTQTMTVDGNVFATTSNTFTETTAAGNLFLFARSNGGANFIGQIYRVKVYDYLDSGNLIRDFWPAVRDSDGTVGMYDTVNDVFYTNAGTGEFTANDNNGEIIAAYAKNSGAWQNLIGTDIDDVNTSGSINLQSKTVTENGTVTPDAGYDGLSSVVVNVQGGGGEDPFTLTDYIESSGTQYVDTGYLPKATTRFELVANVASSNSSFSTLFGSRTADRTNSVIWFSNFNNDRKNHLFWFNGAYASSYTGVIVEGSSEFYGKKAVYNLAINNALVLTNQHIGSGAYYTGTHPSNVESIYLFSLNENGADYGSVVHCIMKMYRFRIYEGDTLVHEFIPWTDGNDVICLKDTVTGDIKYNAGTGTFVRGSDT